MTNDSYDLIVIGGGPGGYVASIRAAQLGLKVACVEKAPTLGGTCLNVGCIPSKALLEASERYTEMAGKKAAEFGISVQGVSFDLGAIMARKQKIVDGLTKGVAFLFKKNKIDHITATGRLAGDGRVSIDGDARHITAPKIIVATGSRPASIPGVVLDGDKVGTSTEALSYSQVPGHLVVIGAGVIGLELGSVWARLGAKVTVLEYMDRILPTLDGDLAKVAQRLLKRQGFEFHLGARVTGVSVTDEGCRVSMEGKEDFVADRVLVATGRKPVSDDLGLDRAGVETNDRGFITVDEHYRTSAPGVYAIGDVIGGAMLAHEASDEGIACVEQFVGGYGHVNYDALPGVVYTDPEIASVGKTEDALKIAGTPYKVGTFQFRANGRAMSLGSIEGMVKILAHEQTDRVLGVHIIGPRAGDLIAEAVVAMEYGASAEDIARAFHAHPSLAEAIREAALDVDGRAIHA